MSRQKKKYDATLKTILEESPPDWLVLAGRPLAPVEVIDADVSTVTAATDKVLRVRGTPDHLLAFDFQAGPDASLPRRVHVYNGLLEDRHDLLVHSVVVLLRPEANLTAINGVYKRGFPGEEHYLVFRYQVIRVWELSSEALLKSGMGTLLLAPISAVTEDEVPHVLERVRQRLVSELPSAEARRLWTAAYTLMGLRYEQAWVDQLMQGVLEMEESVTYQAIIAKGEITGEARGMAKGLIKGEVKGLRRALLMNGEQRFGSPDRRAKAVLKALDDLAELEALVACMATAKNWDELLGFRPRRKRS